MKPFIRSDQYHFIKAQTQILINGHASANDTGVLDALKSLAKEKVLHLFADVSKEQAQLLQPIVDIKNKEDAEVFLSQIKPYVVPFQEITEQTIKKLFPKVKKLKVPSLEHVDVREISYLGWNDQGSNKKYLVAPYHNRLIGLQGTFNIINQKGICALCNHHAEVGMFMSKTKGSGIDTFTKRGNYICQDSYACNHNLTTLEKLHDFIERLQ